MKQKSNNIDQNIELLSKIEKAEISPFVKTRIDQLIENSAFQTIKPKWAWGMLVSFVLILGLNVAVLQTIEPQNNQTNTSMNSFASKNTLY